MRLGTRSRTRISGIGVTALYITIVAMVGCGDASVVEGVDLEIQIDAPFASSNSAVATITPSDTPGYSDAAGAVACVYVDLPNSFAAVNTVQGEEGGAFTLTATIVSGGVDTRLLTWDGVLEVSQNQTLFTSDTIDVNTGANDALTTIYQAGEPWQLRLEISSGELPDLLSVRIAPRLTVNTSDGGCN